MFYGLDFKREQFCFLSNLKKLSSLFLVSALPLSQFLFRHSFVSSCSYSSLRLLIFEASSSSSSCVREAKQKFAIRKSLKSCFSALIDNSCYYFLNCLFSRSEIFIRASKCGKEEKERKLLFLLLSFPIGGKSKELEKRLGDKEHSKTQQSNILVCVLDYIHDERRNPQG